ncbi:hypothetical protein ACLKA6_004407 [Drosophila palustris]
MLCCSWRLTFFLVRTQVIENSLSSSSTWAEHSCHQGSRCESLSLSTNPTAVCHKYAHLNGINYAQGENSTE